MVEITDELLRRVIVGDATADELAGVARWREAGADHERRYRLVARLLDTARAAALRIDPGAPPPPEALVWAAAAASRGARQPTSHGPARWRWGLAAAAALVAAVAGLRAVTRSTRDGPLMGGLGADRFVTGKAELATVLLKDGTLVRLGPESRLRLLSSRGAREVELEGRAFLAVAKDPNRPFKVKTARGDAIALGTRFQVDATESNVEVLVVEGRVALSARGQSVELGAGQTSKLAGGLPGPVITVPDVAAATAWVRQLLVFRETPLREAMRDVERAYGVRAEITDTALARRTITMWFSDRSLEEVATAICAVVAARCWIEDHRLTIRPK